uniref:DUF3700 domain-containing protein n=1 Tax=Ananas comosus var. bracteatus TaxID=296719 RepID=A0A6V7PFL1_ANACO|nr:unnamed protein product [Ananas comosus var. bracteatus]
MLGVFSGEVVEVPAELTAAGSRTPSPKTRASVLVDRFLASSGPAVSAQEVCGEGGDILRVRGDAGQPGEPAAAVRAVVEGRGGGGGGRGGAGHRGLQGAARPGAVPPSFMLAHLSGDFAFVLFDRSTSSLLVASDPNGKIPLFWGITADGCVAFSDDVDLLKGSCGKSLAQFPQGCFYSNSHGGLRSFENPKHRVTAIPADEEEICGATFKVEGAFVAATI